MPRFAILTHDHPFLHWDLLLEGRFACRTWRILMPPDSAEEIPAEALPDHRIKYLDYEGPVSGDRGTVERWDAGTFEWVLDQPTFVEVRLDGFKVKGNLTLVASENGLWTMLRR